MDRYWRGGDLKNDIWKVIEPDLHLAEHVHLQGWGEPLLHPMLPIWVAKTREKGCTIGITTNGDLLDVATDWLLEGNVDLITVSAAGALKNHETLRGGSKLEQVLASAGKLAALTREKGLKMKIQMSFLLTRSNTADLPKAVELAARSGLDEVFVTHLDCRPTKPHYEQAAYNDDTIIPEGMAVLKVAEKTARRFGIRFRYPNREGEEVLACALNPLYFAFVSWDGKVGPCVNLLLPLNGQIPRWGKAGETRIEPVVYGRLNQASLPELLASRARERFIYPFRQRLAAEVRFLSSLDFEPGIRSLRELERAGARRREVLDANPLPSPCAGCPKALRW